MIADTTFIIDIMLNDVGAVERARQLAGTSTALLVGTPSVFELYVGVALSKRSSEEREKILAVLSSLTQLPLDGASASRAGLIYGERVKEGVRIDPEDAMLAGIAIENHQALLTRNRKDFAGIRELRLESY